MVFTPIWDHNPLKWPTPPYVMWALVITNFVVYFYQVGSGQIDQADRVAGLIPAAFSGGGVPGTFPAPITLLTSLFLHANFMHVFGNMLYLFVFGDDIEEVLGHWRFLGFYLACGVCGGLLFIVADPTATTELIGASGAVAGVISAYLLFRPCAKIWCLLGLIPLHLRAYWIIGSWAILQTIEATNGVQDGVAYWAHVGGLIAGAVLFALIRPAGVALLDCVHSEPVEVDGRFEPPG